jgi:hypothetical protein
LANQAIISRALGVLHEGMGCSYELRCYSLPAMEQPLPLVD